ncbi:hypothetical protein ACP70R_021547 [Stipagrostis hirtigluma subsp. patula]
MAMPEEMVEEVLLRFPPDDPASLLRAALVCKPWRRLVSGSRFRRRFRELHRPPPMLGFCYLRRDDPLYRFSTRFLPTTSFRPRRADLRGWKAVDSRHGRVLLVHRSQTHFAVWDPITDEQQQLPSPPAAPSCRSRNVAVVCAAAGACDHLDCQRGHFNVVFVCTGSMGTFLFVYSSEFGAWSQRATLPHREFLNTMSSAVVGNALYFLMDSGSRILRYELGTQEMSLIQGPHSSSYEWPIALMTMEDGMLGFATLLKSGLHLWSREIGPDRDARWVPSRVIAPETLLPFNTLSRSPAVIGFADGVRVLFLWSDDELFTVDLKSDQTRKVCGDSNMIAHHVVPYMSFYTPALQAASTEEGPNRDVSSA